MDLHRHLLGSARPETLWEFARKYEVVAGTRQFAEFRDTIVHRDRPRDLEQYIAPWTLFREVVREPEDVWRIAYEAAQDARLDGVCYVEFRSSLPSMPSNAGHAPQTRIPTDAFLEAIRDAFSQDHGVVCVLVASVLRHAAGLQEPDQMKRYTTKFLGAVSRFRDLVVGVDLTGIERTRPARLFRDLFAEARAAGLPVTIHAGETEGPHEIWTAVEELGASRIGHGTSAPTDPALVAELARRRIVLEVCPTSTWLVGGSETRERHPIIDSADPIPFVICTDNPTLNASTLSQELSIGARVAGQTVDDFTKSQWHVASEAAFAPEALVAATGYRDLGMPT